MSSLPFSPIHPPKRGTRPCASPPLNNFSSSSPKIPRRARKDITRRRKVSDDTPAKRQRVNPRRANIRSTSGRSKKKKPTTEVAVDGKTARPVHRVQRKRKRRIRRLRPVRTEWPLVNGRDPLDQEILDEIPSPRRPHDPAQYEIPKRVKKPSSADLLFDAYLAKIAGSATPLSMPPSTPSPLPSPERRWASFRADLSDNADSDQSEWSPSMFPWLLPLGYDVNGPRTLPTFQVIK